MKRLLPIDVTKRNKDMKIALAQMEAYDSQITLDSAALLHAWTQRLNWAIESATTLGAQLLVLPELATTPYLVETQPQFMRSMALPRGAAVVREAMSAAAAHGLALVIPFPELGEDGACYNSLSVSGFDGTEIAHYRKMHVPSGVRAPEREVFAPGRNGPCVFNLNGVQVGVAICYDRHFPELFRVMALQGAEVAIVPSAATGSLRSTWQAEGIAHAVFNRMYYLAVNRVGTEMNPNRPFFGESFAVSPWGKVLLSSKENAMDCILIQVEREDVVNARKAWPFLIEQSQVWEVARRVR